MGHAGLLGAGTGAGSCAAAPFRSAVVDWAGGCPVHAPCCSEFGYCRGREEWLAGGFRDCNGESNGRPLEAGAIAAENAAAAAGDFSAANILVVPAGGNTNALVGAPAATVAVAAPAATPLAAATLAAAPLAATPLAAAPLPATAGFAAVPGVAGIAANGAIISTGLANGALLETPVSPLPTAFCSTELPEQDLLPMLPEASTDMPPTEPLSPDMTLAETPSTDLP